jgi:hypothetical protein
MPDKRYPATLCADLKDCDEGANGMSLVCTLFMGGQWETGLHGFSDLWGKPPLSEHCFLALRANTALGTSMRIK